MTHWQLYWLTRLDGVGVALAIAMVLLCIFGFVLLMAFILEDVSKPKWYPRMIIAGIAIILALVFIPSTKEAISIIVVPKIVNNEQVQELPENALKYCNEWLKSQIPQAKGESK